METSEFQLHFKKIPFLQKHFVGVFAIDKIPNNLKEKSFIVINLDPHYKKGSHWICAIKLHKNELEIFDSLGVKIKNLVKYFKFKKKITINYNKNPVQDLSSILCGKFVIMYIVERMFNQDMEMKDLINEIFVQNLKTNDEIVLNFFKQYMQ